MFSEAFHLYQEFNTATKMHPKSETIWELLYKFKTLRFFNLF